MDHNSKMGRVGHAGAESTDATDNDPLFEIVSTIDCLGTTCPRPQLMTKKALSVMDRGGVIAVLVDSPSSMEAIPPMLPALNARLLQTAESGAGWIMYIEKM